MRKPNCSEQWTFKRIWRKEARW